MTRKEKLTAWYNQHISAAWYRSSVLVCGWLISAALFLPDLLDFMSTHWGWFSEKLLPRQFSAETKALILSVYVTFIQPPLRAWKQKKMQAAALKQAEEIGKVVVVPPPVTEVLPK